MRMPHAMTLRSSIGARPGIRISGRSPTMICTQRSAAPLNAAFCVSDSPPRNSTSMREGDSVSASIFARVTSAIALYVSLVTTGHSLRYLLYER